MTSVAQRLGRKKKLIYLSRGNCPGAVPGHKSSLCPLFLTDWLLPRRRSCDDCDGKEGTATTTCHLLGHLDYPPCHPTMTMLTDGVDPAASRFKECGACRKRTSWTWSCSLVSSQSGFRWQTDRPSAGDAHLTTSVWQFTQFTMFTLQSILIWPHLTTHGPRSPQQRDHREQEGAVSYPNIFCKLKVIIMQQ